MHDDKPSNVTVTDLLRQWSGGDATALDHLLPLIYSELKTLAARALSKERSAHTLQTTALVNEAYLRVVGHERAQWANRQQFIAIAAQAMRRVLVDHARRHNAEKRPPAKERLDIDEIDIPGAEDVDLVQLDAALERLEQMNSRQARVVELRFFAGMNRDEIAEVLDVGSATVERDWRMARAWLRRQLA